MLELSTGNDAAKTNHSSMFFETSKENRMPHDMFDMFIM